MLKIIPLILLLKSPAELEKLNEKLTSEIELRKRSEAKLLEDEKILAAKNDLLEKALRDAGKQKEELAKLNNFMVEREIKMTELKKEIESLKNKEGQG